MPEVVGVYNVGLCALSTPLQLSQTYGDCRGPKTPRGTEVLQQSKNRYTEKTRPEVSCDSSYLSRTSNSTKILSPIYTLLLDPDWFLLIDASSLTESPFSDLNSEARQERETSKSEVSSQRQDGREQERKGSEARERKGSEPRQDRSKAG